MCAEGRLQSFVTPGGHRRIARANIEAIREGSEDLKRSGADHSPSQSSPILRQKKERIEELNLTFQEKRATMALQQLEEDERRAAAKEEAAREEQEREARRMRLEAKSEQVRRQRERDQARDEERAAQSRQEWFDEWIRDILSRLPRDIPRDCGSRSRMLSVESCLSSIPAPGTRRTL